MTLESCSASTLSLLLNCASLSASLTMTARPVSSTLRTMLSLIAPAASATASRLTLRAARIRAPRRAPVFSGAGVAGALGFGPVMNASSFRRMRPFSAPVTSMTASSMASRSGSISFIVISFSLNS